MSKYKIISDYFRTCPQLSQMMDIYGREGDEQKLIRPAGTSQMVQYQERRDVYGGYIAEIVPFPSVYEDYNIEGYYIPDSEGGTENILDLDDMQAICDWIIEQNNLNNLPQIPGKKIVSIEPYPFNPQIRYVDNDFIAYFITVRIRYVNQMPRKSVEYEAED